MTPDTLAIQSRVSTAIAARGYLSGWTDTQLIGRHLDQFGEVAAEAFAYLHDDSPYPALVDWLRDLVLPLDRLAKDAFDDRTCWGHVRVHAEDVELLAKELTDVQVVVLSLAEVIGRMRSEPFDVVALAVEKAEADIERGVRT